MLLRLQLGLWLVVAAVVVAAAIVVHWMKVEWERTFNT
jgi:hypothetical protein